MKKIITLVVFFYISFANTQAYKGKGDCKGQVGANIQSGGNGIFISSDFGIGENMSYGFSANYLLSANTILDEKPKFEDRFDLKARFNANLGNVFKLDKSMDIYPGLDLGLRNFGAHIGFRYFFTDGFGVFAETCAPIARYNGNIDGFRNLNNQFALNIGASFNL